MMIIGAAAASYLLTCWALIDVSVKDFGTLEKKAVWSLISFIPFVGWIIYLLWGRKKGKRHSDEPMD